MEKDYIGTLISQIKEDDIIKVSKKDYLKLMTQRESQDQEFKKSSLSHINILDEDNQNRDNDEDKLLINMVQNIDNQLSKNRNYYDIMTLEGKKETITNYQKILIEREQLDNNLKNKTQEEYMNGYINVETDINIKKDINVNKNIDDEFNKKILTYETKNYESDNINLMVQFGDNVIKHCIRRNKSNILSSDNTKIYDLIPIHNDVLFTLPDNIKIPDLELCKNIEPLTFIKKVYPIGCAHIPEPNDDHEFITLNNPFYIEIMDNNNNQISNVCFGNRCKLYKTEHNDEDKKFYDVSSKMNQYRVKFIINNDTYLIFQYIPESRQFQFLFGKMSDNLINENDETVEHDNHNNTKTNTTIVFLSGYFPNTF